MGLADGVILPVKNDASICGIAALPGEPTIGGEAKIRRVTGRSDHGFSGEILPHQFLRPTFEVVIDSQ